MKKPQALKHGIFVEHTAMTSSTHHKNQENPISTYEVGDGIASALASK